MKTTIPPSEAEIYGLDRTNYHAVLMESGLHDGRILQIQRGTPHEIYILVEGSISNKVQLFVQKVIKVVQHDDGMTTDYMSGSIELLTKVGIHQK